MGRFPCQTGIRAGTGSPARQRVVRKIVGCPSGRTCETARGCRQEGQRKFEIGGVSAGWAQASSPSPLRIPQYGARVVWALAKPERMPDRFQHVPTTFWQLLRTTVCVVLHFDSCESGVF